MIAAIHFEYPLGWLWAIPLGAVLGLSLLSQVRRGVRRSRMFALTWLRMAALLPLLVLLARPFWIAKEPAAAASRAVALLVDRSESMSLEDVDVSRYDQALQFLRGRLLPALKSAGLPVRAKELNPSR